MKANESATVRGVVQRSQVSLGTMLLLMMIACMVGAMLFYGSRIGEVQDELRLFFGYNTSSKTSESSRITHLVFLLFTYSSPLLLAGIIATVRSVLNRRDEAQD